MFDKGDNRLLAELDPTDYALVRPHLSTAYFARGEILQEQEAPVAQVYFPMSGLVSLVSVMEDGHEIETAVVGRDGAVGAFVGLGRWNAIARATVQIPATCAVIATSHFRAAVSQNERIRDLMLRFREALFGQVQQNAACNALHPLEDRFARWLLQALDLTGERELPLTQQSLSKMLGAPDQRDDHRKQAPGGRANTLSAGPHCRPQQGRIGARSVRVLPRYPPTNR